MRKFIFLLALLVSAYANAQNYLISFAGAGAAGMPETVTVENLSNSSIPKVTLNGTDILHLSGPLDVEPVNAGAESGLVIYPNPATTGSTISFVPPSPGDASIIVTDASGKQLARYDECLDATEYSFRISGMKSGFYFIRVTGDRFSLAGKLISKGAGTGKISLEKTGRQLSLFDKKEAISGTKGTAATIDMAYAAGNRLKFTGRSGIYSTTLLDIPTSGKTVTFNFVNCTDGDNNNYPVIELGSQVWMEKNLKTTRFSDASSVTEVTDAAAWAGLSSSGYCWYNNNLSFRDTYGGLYNWYALNPADNGNRNVCPVGWHVPSSAEWNALINYLTGISYEYPDNLPGTSIRNDLGTFLFSGVAYWWSSSQSSATNGIIVYKFSGFYVTDNLDKNFGLYVRCLRN